MAFDITQFSPMTIGYNGLARFFTYNAGSDSLATVIADGYFDDVITQVKTGDKILVTTTTDGLSFSGTFRVDFTNQEVLTDWDRTYFFETQMSDISAATTSFITVPPVGVITEVYALKWSAITVASAVITFSIGSTAITGGVATVTVAGAAGTLYTGTPSALNITDGTSAVKAVSDGGSTDTAIATVGFKIVCPAQV
jgi:hypothetical protein